MADDVETLLTALMAEVKLLRAENLAILQGLKDDSDLHLRLGVHLTAQDGERLRLLEVSEVCFMTTDPLTDNLVVRASDGQGYVNFESLDLVGQRFQADPRLMRTHKSFLVNLNQIRTVDNASGGRILAFKGLPDDVTAKVSEDNRGDFLRRLGIQNA